MMPMLSSGAARLARARLCAFALTGAHLTLATFLIAGPARAQQTAIPDTDIVLTPNRGPTSIQRSGSSVSIITAEDIARRGAGNLADALATVPGLSITQNGGPAGVTSIRMRGGTVGQTLVLIDGVRMNDPTAPSSEFDFGLISPTDIERIEVLRGPQSALYGSDAIGGVINIITRRGNAKPRFNASIGAGSYGTVETRASASGAHGPWNFAASTTGFRTSGFSAFGHRIPRLTNRGPFERDTAEKLGTSLRLGYRPNADFSVDTAVTHHYTFSRFDSSFADSVGNSGRTYVTNGVVNARLATLDGQLNHRLSTFAARTERRFNFSGAGVLGNAFDYQGDRYGVEYQGDLNLGTFGTLSLGSRYEHERLAIFNEPLPRGTRVRSRPNSTGMNTLSAFALHQIELFDRLDLSLAGRMDHVDRAENFLTWRATAAYRITETGTRFRASIGTGAKAPTLYQLFSEYGKGSLDPERSRGVDAGIEQSLWQGRVKLGVGVFQNRFRDLIAFGNNAQSNCTPVQRTVFFGCYYNIGSARTEGFEGTADIQLYEDRARLRASVTIMDAKDRATGLRLIRNPTQQAFIGLDLMPFDRLTITPGVNLVGKRVDNDFDAAFRTIRVYLKPYARLDVAANYRLTDHFSLYARAENLNGARIETVRNYGSTGRAFYGGINATW